MRVDANTPIPARKVGEVDHLLNRDFANEDKQWLPIVLKDLRTMGWWCYHTKNAMRSQAGMPDILAVHRKTGHTVFIELKTEGGVVSAMQAEALQLLAIKNEVYLWRPSDSHELIALVEHEWAAEQLIGERG